jgi:hypothetical protein
MRSLKRYAAIIKPKRPFAKWANWAYSISGDVMEYPYKHFQKNCSIVLIRKYYPEKEARAYINTILEDIFEMELKKWLVNEPLWPRDRTQKMFWQWFGVEFRYDIFDSE